jgi:hypothetical protein
MEVPKARDMIALTQEDYILLEVFSEIGELQLQARDPALLLCHGRKFLHRAESNFGSNLPILWRPILELNDAECQLVAAILAAPSRPYRTLGEESNAGDQKCVKNAPDLGRSSRQN